MTQRYDTYKDSGVQWLGEIPGHWERTTLRKFLRLFSEKNHGDKQLLSVTREQGVIVRDIDSKEGNHNFIPDDLSGYKYVQIGDFVINKMKSWQGSYGVSNYEGIVSPAYYTCKLEGIDRTFFSLAIRSKIYVSFFGRYSKGIRVGQWDLSPFALTSIPFAVPPLSEQRSIVSYLDDKCGKIDEWVTKKQKEVEHLQELKQRVIADAVTRGLNPHVKMKATNIPWIKEIPEHWEMRKMKYLFDERSEKNHPNEPMLSATQSEGVILQSKYQGRVVVVNTGFEGLKLVKVGDFVIHLRSFQGGIEYAHDRGIISSAYTILNPKYPEYSAYYKRLFKSSSFIDLLKICVTGIREGQNINYSKLKQFSIPVPPLSEQKQIVSYLDTKCAKIDKLITNITKEIDCIKEYKQRLISDVVTGQIKVC